MKPDFACRALRRSAKPDAAKASEELIAQTSGSGLSRVNALAFRARHSLNKEDVSASRVQGLAKARSVFVTRQVVEHSEASKLSRASEVAPTAQQRSALYWQPVRDIRNHVTAINASAFEETVGTHSKF